MKNELKEREIEGGLKGYYDYEVNGKKYSVVDFGTTMASHPMPAGIFMGWEALPIDEKGDLGSDPIRAKSWEELKKIIDSE